MGSLSRIYATVLCLVISPVTTADLPLTVEDLITDKGRIKIDVSLSYVNNDRQNLLTGDPIVIQTGDTSFVTLPTKVGEFKGNTDTLVGTLGLRYGIIREAELYMRASYLNRSTRSIGLSGMDAHRENRFVDFWLGFNYQLSQDNDTPALLGFIEGAVHEKHPKRSSFGKSWVLGVTTYRAIDPVVLAVTSSFKWNQKVNDNKYSFKIGSYFLLTPSVAFAVT